MSRYARLTGVHSNTEALLILSFERTINLLVVSMLDVPTGTRGHSPLGISGWDNTIWH